MGAFFIRCLPIELAQKRCWLAFLKFLCQDYQNGQKGQNGQYDQNGRKGQSGQKAKVAKMVKKAKMAKIAKIAEISRLAETETVIFLKTFKVWVFFEKKREGFFEKNFNFIGELWKKIGLLSASPLASGNLSCCGKVFHLTFAHCMRTNGGCFTSCSTFRPANSHHLPIAHLERFSPVFNSHDDCPRFRDTVSYRHDKGLHDCQSGPLRYSGCIRKFVL